MNPRSKSDGRGRHPSHNAELDRAIRRYSYSTSRGLNMGTIPNDFWEPLGPRLRSGNRLGYGKSRSGRIAGSPPFDAFGGQ